LSRERIRTIAVRMRTSRAEANLRLIEELDKEVDVADAQIHKLFARDERVRRLLPIPGVGIITGAIVVAEVGDIDRFPAARQFASWCGLTPTEHSSAENIRRGHITKQGSRWLRWVLVEAAVHAYRNHELSRWQTEIANRRGDKIARVALARRIATLCFHALRSQHGCRAFRLAQSDSLHRPVGAHPLEFMASGDGRFLIGSLDRMLTMDVNRIDE
jgi:transposase